MVPEERPTMTYSSVPADEGVGRPVILAALFHQVSFKEAEEESVISVVEYLKS